MIRPPVGRVFKTNEYDVLRSVDQDRTMTLYLFRLTVCCLVALASGCNHRPATVKPGDAGSASTRSTTDLVFLTRDGCVNTTAMRANLDEALRSLGLPTEYQVLDLETVPNTDTRAGYGTPTVLYRNRDLFGMPEPRSRNPEAT